MEQVSLLLTHMHKKELDFILQEGEGLKIEFKESFDKSIAEVMVAFANSVGGRIFLGVNDNGVVKGVHATNTLRSQIQDLARNCDPALEVTIEELDNLLIITVEEGKDKPYKCSSGFYSREGPNSQKLTRDEILQLVHKLGKVRFDEQINRKFTFPKDFDEERFSEFLTKAKISNVIPIHKILANLSLGNDAHGFKMNNAGVLLFAKEQFFRQSFVTCVLYKGKERVDVIDKKDFSKDLFSNYEDTFAFLRQHLRLEYEITGYGPRKEIPEIPYEALREAIVNAIIHRDYFEERFGIFVEVFDDRVEITNKGELLFDRKKLGKLSVPRNPIIFDIFYRLGLIERVGSGINRIKSLVRKQGLKVAFEVDDFFRIVFHRPATKKAVEKTVEKTVEKILVLLKENPQITQVELAQKTGLSRRGVEWNIEQLKKAKKIKRIGSDKEGYWKIS